MSPAKPVGKTPKSLATLVARPQAQGIDAVDVHVRDSCQQHYDHQPPPPNSPDTVLHTFMWPRRVQVIKAGWWHCRSQQQAGKGPQGAAGGRCVD
jgi:hypothetical protein